MGNVAYDWGDNPTLAPTAKRVDPLGWLLASLVVSLAIALAVVSLLWRPIPGVDAPPGSLPVHVKFGAEALAHWIWPGVFAGDVREYLRWLSLLGPAALWAAMWRVVVACVFACASPLLLWRRYMVPRDSLIHLRGSLRFEGVEAERALRCALAVRNKRAPDHEIAPRISYPGDMWTRHVLVIGGVGSGKSTAMKPLIKKVIEARERLILFDPKGEFTKGFGQPLLIAPWDARSCSWDIGKDMRNIGDMRRFAAAMIKEGQDPMWANASRQILVGFMIYLSATRGSDWGWGELADLLAIPQGNLLPIMSRYHPEAIRAVERASVTTHGILINLASFCAPIFDLAEAWGVSPPERRISFVEWTLGEAPIHK
ncbi:MAG: type IV secretion system DNA-binding domain-containing protein [Rubrivivax sp.]